MSECWQWSLRGTVGIFHFLLCASLCFPDTSSRMRIISIIRQDPPPNVPLVKPRQARIMKTGFWEAKMPFLRVYLYSSTKYFPKVSEKYFRDWVASL